MVSLRAWKTVGVLLALMSAWSPQHSWGRQPVCLDGEWEFRFAPDDSGQEQEWFRPAVAYERKLQVPGVWQAQGVGDPGVNRFLRYSSVGVGWYRRSFDMPPAWRGKQVWLQVDGVHRNGRVWLNGKYVGEHKGYPVGFRFNLTPYLRQDEEQVLVIAVDCRKRGGNEHGGDDPLLGTFDIAERGWGLDSHWGGIYESVWIEATADVWVEDAFVQPDPAAGQAKVEVTLQGLSPLRDGRLLYTVRQWQRDGRQGTFFDEGTARVAAGAEQVMLTLELAKAPLWTPYDPNLLVLELDLEQGGKGVDRHSVRFGQRRLEIRGNDFYLNGDRFMFIGYGDDWTFPIEAVPHGVAFWRKYLQVRKDYGFIGVRHHSCMPPKSYMQAADEVGMLVQPELPIVDPRCLSEATDKGRQLYHEVWEGYIRAHRNRPSVFSWCMGNEAHPDEALASSLYNLAKRLDPSRFVIHTDGTDMKKHPTLDYLTPAMNELALPWGPSANKYRLPAGKVPEVPLIAHEICNKVTLPNPADVKKFTGLFEPFWLEAMSKAVKRNHLEKHLPAMLDASWKLQASQCKLNNESARLCPEVDGYHQWLFRDYWCNSSGWVNMFDEARAITPEMGRQINNPAVWLWQRNRVNYRCREQVTLEFYLSDFRLGRRERIAELKVTLGEMEATAIAPPEAGQAGLVGPWRVQFTMPDVSEPRQLTLRTEGGGWNNEWPLWVFPKHDFDPGQSGVVIKSKLSKGDLEKLDTGQSIFLLDGQSMVQTINGTYCLTWWSHVWHHVFGNMIMKHPAMDRFPHDGYGDLQMYDMIASQRVMVMKDLPVTIEPIVWCLDIPPVLAAHAYLFEVKVGPSKMLVTTLDFSSAVRAKDPAADWLYHELIRYCSSPDFAPQQELSLEWFKARVARQRKQQ